MSLLWCISLLLSLVILRPRHFGRCRSSRIYSVWKSDSGMVLYLLYCECIVRRMCYTFKVHFLPFRSMDRATEAADSRSLTATEGERRGWWVCWLVDWLAAINNRLLLCHYISKWNRCASHWRGRRLKKEHTVYSFWGGRGERHIHIMSSRSTRSSPP